MRDAVEGHLLRVQDNARHDGGERREHPERNNESERATNHGVTLPFREMR